MATSTKNTGTARATSTAKPAATGATPAKTAAPKVAAKPKVTYTTVKVKGADGKVKSVLMEQSKANALAVKRAGARGAAKTAASTAATTALIPGAYRDLVDPAAIDAAVSAQIASVNTPLDAAKTDAQTQYEANIARNQALQAQTQASLRTLAANAGTIGSAQALVSGQGLAATDAANVAARAGTESALGTAFNPLVAGMVDSGRARTFAQQLTDAQRGSSLNQLAANQQADFFQRGQAIDLAGTTVANNKQASQLQTVMQNIATAKAGNESQRAELVRKYAAEEANFKLQENTANAALEQQGITNGQKDYANTTDRLSVAQRATAAKATADAKTATANAKLSEAQQKAVSGVETAMRKQYDKLHAGSHNVTTPVMDPVTGKPKLDKNGKPVTTTQTVPYTTAELFPAGGPIRQSITLLTGATVGMDPSAAAMVAASWFPQLVPKLKVADLVKLGVDGPTISKLVGNQNASTAGAAVAADKAAAAAAQAPTKIQLYLLKLGTNMSTAVGKTLKVGGVSYTVDALSKAQKVQSGVETATSAQGITVTRPKYVNVRTATIIGPDGKKLKVKVTVQ